MNTALRFAAATVLALAVAPVAHAQSSPTLSVVAPTTKVINPDNMNVSLQYNLTGGTYAPAEIVLVMPAGALYASSSFPDTFTHVESPAGTHRWRTANPFVVDNVGTAGSINVNVDLPTWTTIAGTNFAWQATLGGTYTPTAGTATTLAVTSNTAVTATTANATWTHWNAGLSDYSWYVHPSLGPGALITYDLRQATTGWQPIAEGYTYRMDLGTGLYFVRAYSDYNNGWPPPGSNPLVIDEQPVELTTVGGGVVRAHMPAGATLGANDLRQPSNSDYPHGHPAHLYVQAFVPCSAIPLSSAALSSAPYLVDISSTAHFRTPGGGIGPELSVMTPGVQAPSGMVGGPRGCFEGGGLDKYYDGETVGPDINDAFNLAVEPPKATLPIEAMLVDLIPAGMSDVSPSNAVGFTTYYCVLTPGTQFSIATFVGSYLGGPCKTTKPADPTTVTHVVWYDADWGAGGAIGTLYANVYLRIPADFVAGGSRDLVNVSYFNGRAEMDGAHAGLESLGDQDPATHRGNTDPWQDSVTHHVVAGSEPYPEERTDYTTNTHLMAPGDFRFVDQRFYVNRWREPARNPTVTTTVPTGVLIEAPPGQGPAIQTTMYDSGECDALPPGPRLHEPSTTERPLVWHFGTQADPYRMRYYCIYTRVWFRTDPTYPWINGQAVDITHTITAENSLVVPPAALVQHFTMAVPPEVQVEVKPACAQEPDESGAFPPAFVVSTTNTAGAALSNVSTTFTVPRAGVDGGTGDATFAGVSIMGTMPPGASFQVSADGTSFGPLGSIVAGDVTHVRLGAFGLAPFGAPVSFIVHLATTAASDTTLVGRARIVSDQIANGDSGASEAFVVGSCHALTISKFYDADGNGAFDGSDAMLWQWPFTIANDGVVIASGITDEDGVLSVVVPEGTYTVAEVMPPGAITWHATTPHDAPSATRTVTIDGADVALTFGNDCACPDADGDLCTWAECRILLAGARRVVPVKASDASCGPDVEPTCVPTGQCGSAACNPQTGACTYDGPSCAAVDFYVPVKGADGAVVGNAHCRLQNGQPPDCDLDEAGRLAIIPLGEGSNSNTCGLDAPLPD